MSETSVHIAMATGDQAPAVLAMLKQARTETKVVLIEHLDAVTPTVQARYLDAMATSDDHLALVAMLGDQVLGMLTVTPLHDQPGVGELGIVVLKDYWHHGIGSLLVDEAIYWFENFAPLDHLVLDVFQANERAVQLYHRFGFVITDEVQSADSDGTLHATYLMEYQHN